MRQLGGGRDDLQPGDLLEVPHIERSHIEAKMQSCGPDQEILEGDADAACQLLSLDATGKLCNFEAHRMHNHVAVNFLGKSPAASIMGLRFSPVDAVRQLYHGHNGKRSFSFSMLSQ